MTCWIVFSKQRKAPIGSEASLPVWVLLAPSFQLPAASQLSFK